MKPLTLPSTLKTFRFWLEPDRNFPMFQRLAWKRVEASIRDILMGGIHPWTTNQDGTDVHPSLIDAFLLRLNDACAKVAELESFGYGHDLSAQQGYYYEKKTRFERTLEYIQKNVSGNKPEAARKLSQRRFCGKSASWAKALYSSISTRA